MSKPDYDILIRGGMVVDGRDGAPFAADVGIKGSLIVAVGNLDGTAAEVIDATGRYVTPGFIDVHTHYDGQATWENTLAPSSNHGVTTIVGGNCGVGFAPCRPEDHETLITVMEGVEDIPEVVMANGIPWTWESFPEYLDVLGQRAYDIDIAMQVPHSPLRVYVMGERGANHEASTEIDRTRMAALVTEAVRAGAVGVSTSRSLNHRAKNGKLAPSVETAKDEVLALAKGLGEARAGVFQIITEMTESPEDEMALIERIAETAKRPVSYSLVETMDRPENWRRMLKATEAANAKGYMVRAQVFPRPVGVMMGLELSLHPIMNRPSYIAIKDLPLEERVARLRDPELRARILSEEPVPDKQPIVDMLLGAVGSMYALGEEPDYMPPPEMRLDERAKAAGVNTLEFAYDRLLEQDGHAILYLPSANFSSGTMEPVYTMMTHPDTVLGLGDGGAHYGMICDAGFPTYVLAFWARDVDEAYRFPIEWVVAQLSRLPAETVGLTDRGVIAVGYKADVNIIDLPGVKLHAPRVAHDLPAGGRRLYQRADGYDATIVSGVVTYRDGTPTGALPGRLVRGDGYAPLAQAS
ncbi:amidohydrolase family protein [Sphingobium sp. EM0848]|uniref:N-acyl-D-amino-acid deacylase family protein n=1 Tax=Sphingobium sp. EM0848 TaxID=2743473 RepID=UPI00159C3E59|nr:amidohydrolase family protein [Sphingobium sp. EM0848]